MLVLSPSRKLVEVPGSQLDPSPSSVLPWFDRRRSYVEFAPEEGEAPVFYASRQVAADLLGLTPATLGVYLSVAAGEPLRRNIVPPGGTGPVAYRYRLVPAQSALRRAHTLAHASV